MKFTVEIELENEAMRRRSDVAEALREVARRVRDLPSLRREDEGRIKDRNGNTVGTWKLVR